MKKNERLFWFIYSPMKIVPMDPTKYPALWKALGIAKIPVPKDPFNK